MRPFLLLSTRAEDLAADEEYAAFLRVTGLPPELLRRIRVEAAPLPPLVLDDYAGQAGHTIAQFHVGDIESEVHDLKAKGVAFETYDMPGVRWDGEIASMEGMGRAAWFKDSEGNTMCLDQMG